MAPLSRIRFEDRDVEELQQVTKRDMFDFSAVRRKGVELLGIAELRRMGNGRGTRYWEGFVGGEFSALQYNAVSPFHMAFFFLRKLKA